MDLRFFCFSLSPDLFHMFCPRTLGALSSNSHKSLVYISLIVLSESGFDLGAFILNSLLPSCSLQEPRCAISASMCLPDVFILFWRILLVQLFCCGVWEQLFLYIFLPFFCCIYPYLHLLFFVVCLPSTWWFYVLFCCWVHSQPSIVPHDPRHILINKNTFCLFCPSCQQAL